MINRIGRESSTKVMGTRRPADNLEESGINFRLSTQLIDLLAIHAPECVSAMLVGSAATDKGLPPSDLDITAFDPALEIGQEQVTSLPSSPVESHLVRYNPAHFFAVLADPKLSLLYMREMRKLVHGKVLFDKDGELARLLVALRSFSLPRTVLQPFFDGAISFSDIGPTLSRRMSFYYSVEHLIFAWFHSDITLPYSKPKWVLRDSRAVHSDSFGALLIAVAQELTDVGDLCGLAEELRDQANAAKCPKNVVDLNLRDCEFLIKHAQYPDAVWPLRMALYQLCRWIAYSSNLTYRDLRSVGDLVTDLGCDDRHLGGLARRILLLDYNLPSGTTKLYGSAIRDLETMWSEYGDKL